MRFFEVLPFIGLTSAAAAATVEATFAQVAPATQLTWHSCGGHFFCSKLDVLLDYQHPHQGRASVPLLKVPAQSSSSDGPYQGMILLNPGGPGASGIDFAQNNGSTIQMIAGSNWDIVGFDPRGIGYFEPLVNCSSDVTSNRGGPLSARSIPRVTDDYFHDQIDYARNLGQQCQKLIGGKQDIGPHMSTATVARDMLSVVKAFAATGDGRRAALPSELLNYYGISYGTFLGQTFASMFPKNVGRMALDGNVSPADYLKSGTIESINHLDGVLASFFIYCHQAGKSACSYYTGSTPKDIYKRFYRSFIRLDARKAQTAGWSNATDVEDALVTLKVGLLGAASDPLAGFGMLPEVLEGLETAIAAQNVKPWTKKLQETVSDPTSAGNVNPEWSSGVICSDQNGSLYNKTLKELRPLIKALDHQSIIGEIWSHTYFFCTGWPIRSKDVYTGPFGGDTATPMLFANPTYDPKTPVENAISSASKYKHAQVLTVDGTGHTTAITHNQCAFAKLGAYFRAGQLPGKDAFCPLAEGPFGITLNGTLQENIKKAGLANLVSLSNSF